MLSTATTTRSNQCLKAAVDCNLESKATNKYKKENKHQKESSKTVPSFKKD
jgi:hypothetical protein